MNIKKIQKYLYGQWGWQETLIIVLIIVFIVKVSEYSEKIAIWLIIILFLAIASLGILISLIPKPIDYDSD